MSALTDAEATELARRIINTMRPTPPLQDWVEELTGLNHDRAWAVFRKLRHENQGGLRIGQFIAAYRDDLEAERRHQTSEPPARCEECGGDGWIPAPDLHVGTLTYSQVQPCRCTAGEQARRVQAKIDAERTRPTAAQPELVPDPAAAARIWREARDATVDRQA